MSYIAIDFTRGAELDQVWSILPALDVLPIKGEMVQAWSSAEQYWQCQIAQAMKAADSGTSKKTNRRWNMK